MDIGVWDVLAVPYVKSEVHVPMSGPWQRELEEAISVEPCSSEDIFRERASILGAYQLQQRLK